MHVLGTQRPSHDPVRRCAWKGFDNDDVVDLEQGIEVVPYRPLHLINKDRCIEDGSVMGNGKDHETIGTTSSGRACDRCYFSYAINVTDRSLEICRSNLDPPDVHRVINPTKRLKRTTGVSAKLISVSS